MNDTQSQTPAPMSGAAYRAHAQKRQAQRPAELVTLKKSGSVFLLRRPDITGMISTGRLPQTLVAEGLAAWKARGIVPADDNPPQLDEQAVLDSLIFMREIVRDACASPRLVELATADDEISAADMLPEDFVEIYQWAMGSQEVKEKALDSFREGRERTAFGDSPDGALLPEPSAVAVSSD
jgi:hypothetical protein